MVPTTRDSERRLALPRLPVHTLELAQRYCDDTIKKLDIPLPLDSIGFIDSDNRHASLMHSGPDAPMGSRSKHLTLRTIRS